jgi:hypothetical protein
MASEKFLQVPLQSVSAQWGNLLYVTDTWQDYMHFVVIPPLDNASEHWKRGPRISNFVPQNSDCAESAVALLPFLLRSARRSCASEYRFLKHFFFFFFCWQYNPLWVSASPYSWRFSITHNDTSQSVGSSGRGIGPSQSQQASGCRSSPETARPLEPAFKTLWYKITLFTKFCAWRTK